MIFKLFITSAIVFMLSTNMTARTILSDQLTNVAEYIKPNHGSQ